MIRTNFMILNKVLSSGIHFVCPTEYPGLEFSTYVDDQRIICNEDHVLNWTVDQRCELEVQYIHQKGQPWVIYKNLGVVNGIIRNQIFPDTPYGRSMALAYVNHVEAKKLASIEKDIRMSGEIFKFPQGVTLKPADRARRILGFSKNR
jgi:hypothetical protein